jgi:hypothetical protein
MWQRLGVVLSVCWIFYAMVSESAYLNDYNVKWTTPQYMHCAEERSKAGLDFGPCTQESQKQWAMLNEDERGDILVYAVLPPIVAWISVLLSIRIGRWVLAGRRAAGK